MARFSKQFETFNDWLAARPATLTSYDKSIIRYHELHPNGSLSDLRRHGGTASFSGVFTEQGTLDGYVQMRSHNQVSNYGKYLSDVGKMLDGKMTENEFQRKWQNQKWIDGRGTRHDFVTNPSLIKQLHAAGELPDSLTIGSDQNVAV